MREEYEGLPGLDLLEDAFDIVAKGRKAQEIEDKLLVGSLSMSVEEIKMLVSLIDNVLETDVGEMLDEEVVSTLKARLEHSAAVAIPTIYLNVYNHERLYGGPEEGGRYYECKTCEHTMPFIGIEDAIDALPETIDTWFSNMDTWRGAIDVVAPAPVLLQQWNDSWQSPIHRTIDIFEDYVRDADSFYSISIEFAPAATETTKAPHYE